jgi:hypothetical protein
MANQTRSTRDREEIRRWAEQRGGKPSHVKRIGEGEEISILRIDFPGYTGEETLEPISWEDWFDKFENQDLVLIYQEEPAGGEHKIVSAATAQEGTKKSARAAKKRRPAATKATKKKAAKSAAKRGVKKAAAKKAAKKKSAAKRSARATKKAGKKAATKKRATKKRR